MTQDQQRNQEKVALVLSGGGARGAYQVGVISAIAHICQQIKNPRPIEIFTGVSAGSINATFMAAYCDDFQNAAKKLVDLWSGLTSDQVFYSDPVHLGKIGLQWMGGLSLGGLTSGESSGRALLDTTPLKSLLEKNIDFGRIERNIQTGHLRSLGITAIDYQTSEAVTFIQGNKEIPDWNKSRRHSEKTEILSQHVMASSAIPLLFPSVAVPPRHFGDGCVRNTHPCGPSIYMGAQRLIIVGVRSQGVLASESGEQNSTKAPSLARVINVLLNAVLLDGIELDVERLRRVNDFVSQVPREFQKNLNYKPLNYSWVSPSGDIGQLAYQKSSKLPRFIRYLIKGLGSLEEASEIISYLLFEPAFCTQLIEMGFDDGLKQKNELEKLLSQ